MKIRHTCEAERHGPARLCHFGFGTYLKVIGNFSTVHIFISVVKCFCESLNSLKLQGHQTRSSLFTPQKISKL